MSHHSLPEDPEYWARLVSINNMENKTIHNIELTSSPTISVEQYLMLRVLRIRKDPYWLNTTEFGLADWIKKAADVLHASKLWKSYLGSFHGKSDEGTLALTQLYQLEVQSMPLNAEFRPNVVLSPTVCQTHTQVEALERAMIKPKYKTPPRKPRPRDLEIDDDIPEIPDDDNLSEPRSYGPEKLLALTYTKTDDKQMVNTALIDFLNALTIHFGFESHWTPYRKSFRAKFGGTSFEARTDGCLQDSSLKTHAIVDVKPMLRLNRIKDISMQEAAQMVAWIKCEPDAPDFISSCGRRVLVSQDRHEIYITFAEYDASYIRYLNRSSQTETETETDTPGFLTLHVLGPWEVHRPHDMEQLRNIMLAIVLRANSK